MSPIRSLKKSWRRSARDNERLAILRQNSHGQTEIFLLGKPSGRYDRVCLRLGEPLSVKLLHRLNGTLWLLSNAVDFLIHGVRKKLGADLIKNVRGAGWMVASERNPAG